MIIIKENAMPLNTGVIYFNNELIFKGDIATKNCFDAIYKAASDNPDIYDSIYKYVEEYAPDIIWDYEKEGGDVYTKHFADIVDIFHELIADDFVNNESDIDSFGNYIDGLEWFIDNSVTESLNLKEEDTEIEVKNPGILEVPEGKNVEDLPIKHFVNLANKKGLATVTKALNNLQVWNKNKNKPLSKWAGDMIDKVTKRFENQKKNESFAIHTIKESADTDNLKDRMYEIGLDYEGVGRTGNLVFYNRNVDPTDVKHLYVNFNSWDEIEDYLNNYDEDGFIDECNLTETTGYEYNGRVENQKNESLINEFSSNFDGTEFGEVEFYSDDLYKWKDKDSIISAIESHSPIDINVYEVDFEPSHNLVITYEVRAEDYDEDRIEAIVIDSLEKLEDKIRDARPEYLENIHSYDYAEKDTIANNISEWVFDGDVDTNLDELESLVGDLDFESYADPDTLYDFLMSFTLDVLLYVESELNVQGIDE